MLLGDVLPDLGRALIGGLLNANSTPTLTMFTTAAQAAVLTWASGVGTEIAFPPVLIPADLNTATGISIHAMAERASDGASDNTFDLRFWSGINATEMGTTGATLTSSPAEISVLVGATALGNHPGVWNVHAVPITHTNNANRMFTAWIEYDKRTS